VGVGTGDIGLLQNQLIFLGVFQKLFILVVEVTVGLLIMVVGTE
jgi:hypothetical protein